MKCSYKGCGEEANYACFVIEDHDVCGWHLPESGGEYFQVIEQPKYIYDPVVDIHYVTIRGSEIHKSKETTAILDFDKYGNIVGIEIFGEKI